MADRFLRHLVWMTALLLSLAGRAQAEDEIPRVSITPIKGNLYLLQGKGGNVVASVGDDGILMIDDDYAEYADAYHQALKSIAGTDKLPRFVINTHWHFDHVGTNAYWGERGAIIVANTNVYKRMSTRQDMAYFNTVVEPSPEPALPVVTYADSIGLRFNHDQLRIQHYPGGHTDGDSVVYFSGENVVHTGDHYFKDAFPFVDIGSGGNVLGFTDNVASILEQIDDDTVIVPGHGAIASKAEFSRYHEMLVATTALVRAGLAEGMSVEAIAQRGLGEEWESYGKGFIKTADWVRFIADSLPRQ